MKQKYIIVGYAIGLVAGLFLTILPTAVRAGSATFFVSPSAGSYVVGDTITASLMIDSGGQAINAGEGSVSFPSDKLEFQSVATSGSIFTFWTSNPSGGATSVSFGGGLSSPGYSGASGKVLSITWKAKATGSATVSVSGSKILANDGAGTNVSGPGGSATLTITAVQTKTQSKVSVVSVSSSSHPDQNKWYSQRTVSLNWSGSSQGYIYALDQSSNTDPNAGITKDTAKTYETVADGVWYFHLKAKTDSGFTPIAHFKLQIDTTAPDDFLITVAQSGGVTNPRPTVSFEAKDSGSGISAYQAKINSGEFFSVKSGDALPKQAPGDYSLIVRAGDQAGNIRDSQAVFKIEGIDSPIILESTRLAGLLDGVHFTGHALAKDIIHIYLNDKEVDHFMAKDKQVAARSGPHIARAAAADMEITWEYIYTQPLFPGSHSFKFSRTDVTGAESALTNAVEVEIEASTIKLSGRVFPMRFVLINFGLITLILLVVIALLLVKLHYLSRIALRSLGGTISRMFGQTEKALVQAIDKDIPVADLTRRQTADLKQKVKKDVRDIVHNEQDSLKQSD